jgi:hypothetical protein
MRPPGSTGTNIAIIILGGFGLLLGVVLGIFVFQADEYAGEVLTGAVSLAGLGVFVAAWGIWQLFRPVPLDPPPRPSRLWLWIVVPLILLLTALLVGAGLFAIAYVFHEMM